MAISPRDAGEFIGHRMEQARNELRQALDMLEQNVDAAIRSRQFEAQRDDHEQTVIAVPLFGVHVERSALEDMENWALDELARALQGRYEAAGWAGAEIDWNGATVRLTRRNPPIS